MKLAFMLLAQHEKPAIPQEDICREYFNCSKETAVQKAKAGNLPVIAFQTGSQKGHWFVHLNDLASLIDKRKESARKDWLEP